MRLVVVVFPFEPVIQIILAFVYRPASSISLIIGIPAAFISTIMGDLSGIPGLFTTSSAFRMYSRVCCFSSHIMSCWLSISLYRGLMGPMSLTKTSNPFFKDKMAAPTPLSPAPKTTILFFIYLVILFSVLQ